MTFILNGLKIAFMSFELLCAIPQASEDHGILPLILKHQIIQNMYRRSASVKSENVLHHHTMFSVLHFTM